MTTHAVSLLRTGLLSGAAACLIVLLITILPH